MSAAPKPRVKVDLKTVFLALSFLGVGSAAGLYGCAQRLAVIFLAGPFRAQSEADSIRTVQMIDRSVGASEVRLHADIVDLKEHLNARSDRMEDLISRDPAIQRTFTQAEKERAEAERRRLDRARMFPNPEVRR